MSDRSLNWLWFGLLLSLLSSARADDFLTVTNFSLPDQFGEVRTCEFDRAKATIILVADRPGAEQIEPWVKILKAQYGSRLAIEGLADVSAVPAFLRSLVRRRIREKFSHPILLDWDGQVVRQLPLTKKLVNLFLIDKQGRVVLLLHGDADPVNRARLSEALERVGR